MLMGAFLICLVSRGTAWLGSGLRFGLGVLALLAMFAFGGRVSLVFSMLIAGAVGLAGLARRLISGRPFGLRTATIVLLLVPILCIVLAIIGETGLFGRAAERFSGRRRAICMVLIAGPSLGRDRRALSVFVYLATHCGTAIARVAALKRRGASEPLRQSLLALPGAPCCDAGRLADGMARSRCARAQPRRKAE